jgi:hypothetical protein
VKNNNSEIAIDMTIGHVRCIDCENYIGGGGRNYNKCKAFPNEPGIPWIIISGKNNHRKVIEGQTGDYIFNLKKDSKFGDLYKEDNNENLIEDIELH